MEDIVGITIYGRGGHGGKTAGMLLAEAALRDKMEIQAFPEYGPEKTGAPVKIFVKLSKKPIKAFTSILKPDIALFLDSKLLSYINPKQEFTKNTKIIVNTQKSKPTIKKQIKVNNPVHVLDGTKLALETLGKNLPNMAMIGALVKITKVVSLTSLVKVSTIHFNKKIGPEKTKNNIDMLKKAHKLAK